MNKRAKKRTLKVLRGVYDLLSSGERWTQRAFAREAPDRFGDVPPESRYAGCWCLLGAALRVGHNPDFRPDLADALGFENVDDLVAWNDDPTTTFRKVRARLRRAIRELEDAV